MSNLITGTQLENTPLFADFRNVDPGLLVLAVSLLNLETAYSSARNNLQKDDDLFRTLGRVAPLSGKARKALDSITQQELQATKTTAEDMTGLQSRYADNVTVNEADNERFKALNAWAADRGIALEAATHNITETYIEYVQAEVEVEIEVEIDEEVDEEVDGEIDGDVNGDVNGESDQSESAEIDVPQNTDTTEAVAGQQEQALSEEITAPLAAGSGDQKSVEIEVAPLPLEFIKNASEGISQSVKDLPASERNDVSGSGKPSESEELKPRTRTITVTKTVTREVERTRERLVTDTAAINRNLAKLASYQSALTGGTADNAVLRQAISNSAEVAEIAAGLTGTGVSLPLATLRELKQGISQLQHWTESLVSTIEAHLDTARTVHTQIEKVSVQINDHQKDAEQVQQRHDAHVEQSDLLQKLEKLLETRKKQAPELAELLQTAIAESDEFLADIREQYLDGPHDGNTSSDRQSKRPRTPSYV